MGNCGCGARWTGLRMEHCTVCHKTFTGTTAGDRHRTGRHDVSRGSLRRRCLTSDEMLTKGMRSSTRASGLEVWGTGAEFPTNSLSGPRSDGLAVEAEGDSPERGVA